MKNAFGVEHEVSKGARFGAPGPAMNIGAAGKKLVTGTKKAKGMIKPLSRNSQKSMLNVLGTRRDKL